MLAAVLAGVAAVLLLGGKKKRGPKRTEIEELPVVDETPPALGTGTKPPRATRPKPPRAKTVIGEPWAWCEAPAGSPKNTYAAFSKDGKECMVFWRPDTKEAVRQSIRAELDKLPKEKKDELCKASECRPDPFAPDPMTFCEWIPDPKRSEFIKKIVLKLWPQIGSGALPPKENAPYFVKFVWEQTERIFAHDFCGFNPVT